ncbi:unnamed protein product [Diatraea saccharalis]|uniref:serine C-palmitoyltransferase n=1 Tax=Diatraea saccharalis TaxID=40085 RepID=A0A9N9WA45_9NEOP|nr:unnamed protein product [Diatraea saccharalis]
MAATINELNRSDSVNSPKMFQENNGELNNGKVNQSNGHMKPKHLGNGITKITSDDLAQPMDWSQYDTEESFEKSTLLTAVLTHLGLYILMFLGFVSQLLFTPNVATEKNREGYAPLYNPFEQFISRYVYRRVRHCFNTPICSAPAAEITIMERQSDDYNWTFRFTGRKLKCLNLSSYNYLGLGATSPPPVAAAVRQYGLSVCSTRAELGTTPLHRELEETLARFLGVEAAVVFGMGFATNTLSLPGLVGPGTLALSDENNHASLIMGLRRARAAVRVFRHNDLRHLERLAVEAIAEGTWRRIVIVAEGVYSMEGTVVPLRALVALKRRLRLQLYLDEAHSAGAMGARGRGVCDHARVPPRDVDVLMGTFTKSFGAAGGYIAGSAALVRRVRAAGHAHAHAAAMPPPVCAQVLWALRTVAGPEGERRILALERNTAYFRRRLREMGVVVLGHEASPVVPLMVYTFSKMAATVEVLRRRGVAAVGVGFPATPLNAARIRFCMTAAHSRAQLDHCLQQVEYAVQHLGLRYSRLTPPPPPPPPPATEHSVCIVTVARAACDDVPVAAAGGGGVAVPGRRTRTLTPERLHHAVANAEQARWPMRVWVSSEGGNPTRPLLVTYRQRAGAGTWQLPRALGSQLQHELERTLCADRGPAEDSPDCGLCTHTHARTRTHMHAPERRHNGGCVALCAESRESRGWVALHLAGASACAVRVRVRVSPARDFHMPFEQTITTTATLWGPRVHAYAWAEAQQHVRLRAASPDAVCATLAVTHAGVILPYTRTSHPTRFNIHI